MENNNDTLGLARQPIFDKHLNVVAYELLYMSEQETSIEKFLTGDQEECNAFITNFTSIYHSGALKALPAFLNVSENFIRSGALPNLSRHNLVVNLRHNNLSEDMLDKVTTYVEAGFRLVLDDFVYSEDSEALLQIADIVRIDVSKRSDSEIKEILKALSRYKVTCLADNLENQSQFEELSEMGFKLFQGPFLAHPTIVEGKKLSSSQSVVIHLLAALQDNDVTPDVLADIMARDPQLTFKLLKIVNSAKYNLPNQIESLTQAVVALGLNEINKWATLLALSSNADRPTELIRQILITARMCEFVAYRTEEVDYDLAFICGILSMLDALLEIDQRTLLTHLPVSDEIKDAITSYEGKAGKLLHAVNLYMVGHQIVELPVEVREIYASSYAEALRWSNEAMQMMEGAYQ
jgi:EAL and modified HD-GYP domain-containing signal transduction protein